MRRLRTHVRAVPIDLRAGARRNAPKCGKLKLRRLFGTGAAVVFKGSGFYQTDYRSESYKKAAEKDKPASESKSDCKGETKSESEIRIDIKSDIKDIVRRRQEREEEIATKIRISAVTLTLRVTIAINSRQVDFPRRRQSGQSHPPARASSGD